MRLTRSDCIKIVTEALNKKLHEDIEESAAELPDLFEESHERFVKSEPRYTIPGFAQLSNAIGGMGHRGTTVLTGGTGLGKSTLIGNLFVNLSAVGKNVYVVPIETGGHDFMDMILSIVANKTRRHLRAADYQEAREKWLPTFFSNRGHVIARHESRLSHMDFLAELYYHWKTRNVTIGIGDNWNFMMEPKAGADGIAQSDRALHDIITFTKIFPIHVWMIMHPKKDQAKKDKGDNRVNSLEDIKGSITSVQEAANVLLFNALENAKDAPPHTHADFCREITIAKARFNGRGRGSKVIYSIDQHSELYKEYKLV